MPPEPLLRAEGLTRRFRRGWLGRSGAPAVVDASLSVASGETLALVGQSGSGKTTLARMLLALERPDSGRVLMEGKPVHALRGAALRQFRARAQIIFQNPGGALTPHRTVGASVTEPLLLQGERDPQRRRARAEAALAEVGLDAAHLDRYPHMLSGGQRQRAAIARALITGPALLVADEPVSALDVSIQAQILALLARLRAERGLALILISHDLAVVNALADRVAVMQRGRIVETGPRDRVLFAPSHPCTMAMIASATALDPSRSPTRALEAGPVSADPAGLPAEPATADIRPPVG